jgi:exopolysaccharide biosynthesis polyprenyl glycosylphosphotransferase
MTTLYRLRQIFLLITDGIIFCLSLYLALWVRTGNLPTWDYYLNHNIFFLLFGVWTIVHYINGLYDFRGFASETPLPRRIAETGGIAALVGIIFFYIYPESTIQPKTLLLITTLFGYTGICLLRLSPLLSYTTNAFKLPLLCIGWNADMERIQQTLRINTQYGIRPTAYVTLPDETQTSTTSLEHYTLDQKIRSIVSSHDIRIIVVTPEALKNAEVTAELYQLLFWDVRIIDSISLFEYVTGSLPTSAFTEGWFLRHISTSTQYVHQKWQRTIDILGAVLIGTVTLAIFPLIALGIKLTSKGPIFFTQKRIGKHGIPFTLYKFRSMYSLSPDGSAEQNGFEFSKKGDTRITRFGVLLRKFRIDELPQILNLIRGDISLIGPRPERPEIVEELTKIMPYYPLRHVVKPGLTGWAVLHQNYTDTIETSLEKLQYDLYYIKNKSILLDISIILKTFRLVLRAMGQ